MISEQVLEVAGAPKCPRPRTMTWGQPCSTNPWTTSVPLPCPAEATTLRTQGTSTLLDSPSLQQREAGPGQYALKLNKQKLWIDPPDLSNSTQSLHTVFAQLLTIQKTLKNTVLPLRRITIRSEDGTSMVIWWLRL